MTETPRCPHCGASRLVPPPRGTQEPAASPVGRPDAVDALYREIRRIREIAQERAACEAQQPRPALAASDSDRRIAELTREVEELRATVARLRGSSAVKLARSA